VPGQVRYKKFWIITARPRFRYQGEHYSVNFEFDVR